MKLTAIFSDNVLSQGWNLAYKGYQDKGTSYRKKQQWKILYHTLMDPLFAQRWFGLLDSDEYRTIFQYRPCLYIKPFRTYISTEWCKSQKLKVIADTYRFMDGHPEVFSDFLTSEQHKTLACVYVGSEKTDLKLTLGYDHQFRKEGEIVLSLDSEKLGRIVSTAFAYEEIDGGQWICRVGCVQGHKLKNGELTKSAQKLMHGQKPNHFIVFALQELCKTLDCDQIFAVSDAVHTYRKKHAIHLPWAHHISFDYDGFWQEAGAIKGDDNWFRLPVSAKRKPMEAIQSKKRAQYKRRYAMLDEFAAKIRGLE